MPPIEALRAWLLMFVDAVAAKQIIAPALNALIGDPKKVFRSFARPVVGSDPCAGESARSRAATFAKTWTRWICFGR